MIFKPVIVHAPGALPSCRAKADIETNTVFYIKIHAI